MNRWMGGVLVLLLGFPAVWADDKPKEPDKPATPAEQYQALLKEAQEAQQVFMKKLGDAKTSEERTKLVQEQGPAKLAPKFLALAEKYPKDPVALDALLWVVTDQFGGQSGGEPRSKALEILTRDHIDSNKLGTVCQSMGFGGTAKDKEFLRAVLKKSKSAEIRAEAALALAQGTAQKVMILKQMKDNPEIAKLLETEFGKDAADELKAGDPAKVKAESEQLFKDFAEKHVSNMKPERIARVVQIFSSYGGKGAETLARSLLEKDTRPEVQGPACLTLAQMLKGRADETATTDPKEADKTREEASKLFERAVEKFADVKTGFRGTVGSVAKRELFDIRHLSVGKPVPDAEGEDQDGQKFKLSDYKGKVVLLDFWSEF
jgi:hypothetical protein